MNNDLISREALKKEIQHLGNANPSYWNKCDVVDRQDVLDEIDNAPTVQQDCSNPTSRLIMQCPECTAFLSRTRSDIFKDSIGEMNFCPNCGLPMKKGGAE